MFAVNSKHHVLWAGLLLIVLILTPPAVVAQPATPLLGFHLGRGDAAHLAAARAAGATFGVTVFSWADIEPEPGYLYWEVPDATMRAADFYDLQIVARLDRPPDWAVTDRGPTPWNLAAYADFVRRVVERYGDRLAGIIIWNEPNTALEWSGESPDPAGYVAMLKAAYPAAKAVNPELPVLLAGLAFTPGDADNVNDLAYLQQLYDAGAGAYFDILAAHPYGFGQPPHDPPDPDRLNFRRLELHRQIMAAQDDEAKPVWVTEMGWRSSAPNPADAWQVVKPRQQASYMQQAAAYAARSYPWLERLAFWELNAAGDDYGYYLWHGPAETSFAYEALVAECRRFNPACRTDPATVQPAQPEVDPIVPILAPDAIIRLGDRATLHPHWVHLHGDGKSFSPTWQGEFFLTTTQANRRYVLLLEAMQVDQPNNRVLLNGVELGYLSTRTRPDPTSTWMTQRFELPTGLARPGVNTLEIAVGLRNPAHQYAFWRWENVQFRRARLAPAERPLAALIDDWAPQPSPSGWSEAIRLRPGAAADFWLLGNRRGEIWQGRGETGLTNQAGNQSERLFSDVLPTGQGELVATDRGLFWRTGGVAEWLPVVGGPATFAYVVTAAGDRFYAGFEAAGVWSAADLAGFWQPAGLADRTVLDLVYEPVSKRLYAATDAGVFVRPEAGTDWQPLPVLPGVTENSQAAFSTRLLLSQNGEPVVRSQDRLWRWVEAEEAWLAFGPAELSQANKIYAGLDCCRPGSLIASRSEGLWQLNRTGDWQRLDRDDTFGLINVTDLLRIEYKLLAAGMVGLFSSADAGQNWQKVDGLPATTTDLLVDPADPGRWLVGTPAGVYRSDDRGQSWTAVSPPWTVWDMAFGAGGRLFVAHASGVAWSDDLGSGPSLAWQSAQGLEGVLFFSVNPHPTDPNLLWAGTWGNDIGVSADGGQTLASLGNGLETLSILAVLWHPTPGQVTVGTIEGLYRTDDAGASWFKLPGPLGQQTVYDLLQTGDGSIWAGAADGLWFSADYGVNWTRVESMPPATVLRLGQFSDTAGEAWLWAGTEADGLWLSADGGQNWLFGGLAGRTVYQLLPDPTRPERLTAATEQGIFAASLPVPTGPAN